MSKSDDDGYIEQAREEAALSRLARMPTPAEMDAIRVMLAREDHAQALLDEAEFGGD